MQKKGEGSCRLYLRRLPSWQTIKEIIKDRKKENGIIQIAGCVGSQKTHLMYALGDGFEYRVIAFYSEEKAKKAYEEYRVFTEDVYLYPARDLLFYHADIKGKLLTDQRMGVLRALIEKEEGKDVTVITTMDAFLDGLARPEKTQRTEISLTGGDVIDLTELEKSLTDMGYERESQIEGPGQFAVRGGIMDVFPLTEELPVRIELWEMRLILLEALTWRASALWKIWKQLRFIPHQRTGKTRWRQSPF